MNAFARKNQERIAALLIKKLGELPHVNGLPDLTALGAPDEVAKQWAAEANLDEENFLAALLEHLEATAST